MQKTSERELVRLEALLSQSLKTEAQLGEYKVERMGLGDTVFIGHTRSLEGSRFALILSPFPEHLPDLKFSKLHFDTLKNVLLDLNGVEQKLDSIGVLSLPSTEIGPFLHIALELSNLLSSGGTSGDYYELVREWANILAAPVGASKDAVLGLWGELLVLLTFMDIEYAVNAWHVSANSTWDFSLQENLPLEVKTTSLNSRIHSFSSNQINTNTPNNLVVVSLMTTEIDNGTSVGDLVGSILPALTPATHVAFLRKIRKVASLLDPAIESLRWDSVRAVKSLKCFSMNDVPSIQVEHPVLEASWRSDLSDVSSTLNVVQKAAIKKFLSSIKTS